MLEHDGAEFYFVTTALAMTRTGLEVSYGNGTYDKNQPLSRMNKGLLRDRLPELRTSLANLGLDLAVMSLDELLAKIDDQTRRYKLGDLTNNLQLLEGRIRDGLKLTSLLSLNREEAEMFKPKGPLFGQKFTTQFPSVTYEVEEAAKCLGLGRSTAAAFHSLRCLEAGIAALSRCLDIPDPIKPHERSWMKLLEKLKAGFEKKWPAGADRMAGDGQFFEETHAALAAMQNPWRNATMHLDQKYTPDEALNIFNAVRRFMIRLSNRLDENGEPKA